jgi:tetratricopeptide (TPR) repeat protein
MSKRILIPAIAAALLAGVATAEKPKPKPKPKPRPAPAKVTKPAPRAPSAWGSAVDYFQKQDATGNWTKSSCKTAAGKFESAAKSLKSADAWFNAGASYARCAMWDDAQDRYEKALKITANHGPSLSSLGEIALRKGRQTDAQRYFARALDGKNPTALQVTGARNNLAALIYRRIRLTTDAGQRKKLEDEAFGHLQRSLAIDSDNVFAYTLMALIYLEGSERNKSRLNLAQILIDQGKKRNDKYAPLWNAAGLLKMKRNAVSAAQKDFRQAIALDPRFVEARMNVAQILLSSRNYQEAESHFREVLKIDAKDYDATIGLGVAQRGIATVLRAQGNMAASAKRIDAAESTYNAAQKLNNRRGDAYYNLGLLYKDYRTNDSDLKKQIEGFRRAKNYFNDYLARVAKNDPKRGEAESNIGACDANIEALNQAIRIQGGGQAASGSKK